MVQKSLWRKQQTQHANFTVSGLVSASYALSFRCLLISHKGQAWLNHTNKMLNYFLKTLEIREMLAIKSIKQSIEKGGCC